MHFNFYGCVANIRWSVTVEVSLFDATVFQCDGTFRHQLTVGALLLALAILLAKFPRVLAYPVIVVFVWIAVALLYKGYKLRAVKTNKRDEK
jgi:hypothetical protein